MNVWGGERLDGERLTIVCQLVLITDVPKNPKKGQNCTTTPVSSLDTAEEEGGGCPHLSSYYYD